MAGANETPRQKMIGMMYLVLTALLALNVSNTVLEKFAFMNMTLEQTVVEGGEANNGTIGRIDKAVVEKGNRTDDTKVLNTAKEVRGETTKILAELDKLKAEIIEETGGKEEDGSYTGMKNMEKMAHMMIKEDGGKKLQGLLNNYAKFLSEKTGTEAEPIAFDGKDDPMFKNNKNAQKKDFAKIQFDQTPMIAGLATISQFETEIVNREAQALDELARKVGAKDVNFDLISLVALPNSRVVAAGTKYEADLFISAASSGITDMEMTRNGEKVEVVGGKGKISFMASGGNYDKDGLAKKSYIATVKLKDSVYMDTITYFVVKPVIQVQSAAVQALYLNCGNEMQINCPQLGTNYKPTFKAAGASSIPGSKVGMVTLVPNAKQVTLDVFNGGNKLGTETFNVRRVPKPEIALTTRGKQINVKQGENISSMRSLNIAAIPDADFKSFLPKDARYRVTGWEVTLARGKRAVAAPMKLTGQEANLGSMMAKAKPGDRLVVEVKRVERMNFKNQKENVNVGTPTFAVPLN